MSDDPIRTDFERQMSGPESEIELARVALLVAAESDPGVDVDGELRRIEAWADELRSRFEPGWNNLQKLARLRALVFEELRFRGDRMHYFSPSNSLLHEVLKRRRGLPLTLGIVMLEVGWRAGLPLEGVGFPGHFLVRLAGEPGDVVLDPFKRGMMVHEEDARQMLEETTGGHMAYDASLLASVGKRVMVVRLLSNLKVAYLRAGEDAKALSVVDRLLLVDPDPPEHLRDRGLLLFRLRRYHEALACLRAYRAGRPDAPDAESTDRQIAALRQLLAALN
jgi:regulator of sirC expression with transglutaminase-like and TPR domain